jgi:CheY-like chemotaxis protein
MSVILVVEPDSRHAAQLAAMARKHLTSELVMADSADRAVAAMADRVPDVLLMSSLLSRQEEATLAAWLRDLGPAAAHVQELTIPILAATPTRVVPKRRGVLAGLRKDRDDPVAIEGCGLDEFARQVSAYVGFAYAHRGITEPVVEAPAPLQIEAAAFTPEPELVPITTAAVERIGEAEDAWVPIALDTAWEEPAPPHHIWTSGPLADNKELLVAATAPEPVTIAAPEPESVAVGEQKPAAIAAAAPHGPETTRKSNSRGRRTKPAQDDWALFDPDQCGFAALVARLDEITDNNHAEQTSADTTVSLVAY